MALFAAYAKKEKDDKDLESTSDGFKGESSAEKSWLQCSSFPENAASVLQKLSKTEAKKRKHEEIKHSSRPSSLPSGSKSLYIEDTKGSKSLASVPQIQLTKVSNQSQTGEEKEKIHVKRKKKKKKHSSVTRYFSLKNKEKYVSHEKIMSEEEFIAKTGDFNKILREEEQNIQLWIEYIELQDFGAGTTRGKTEKKISIVDKALSCNPANEELLSQKMILLEKIYPFDKLNSEAKSILRNHPYSKVGREWLISSIQFNLSKMTAPGVLETYATILQHIHRQPSVTIIEIVFECGLFLRQAGLWEQLWTLIFVYLEMSFTTAGSGAFKIEPKTLEGITALEDNVITSGLTLAELWLRIENLRTCIHFLPVTSQEGIDDPQRIVLPEDLSNLLYPLSKYSRTRLTTVVFLLLKVPLLPCTDSFFDFVCLENVPWAMESTELFFSAELLSHGIIRSKDNNINILKELLVSPQCLAERIGDVQFQKSIDALFQLIFKYYDQDLQALLIWQVRWWRLLIRLKQCQWKLYELRAKKFLRLNRDFIPLYIEYALLQEDLGNLETAQQILETTLDVHDSPVNLGTAAKPHLCTAYRVLAELLLRMDFENNKHTVIKILVALSFGEKVKNITSVSEELTSKALERYGHVTTELVLEVSRSQNFEDCIKDETEMTDLSLEELLMKPYAVSWIACNVLLSYLVTDKIDEGSQILEKALTTLEPHMKKKLNRVKCAVEGIYEIYIDLLHHYYSKDSTNFARYFDILFRAIALFPNNVKFLQLMSQLDLRGMKMRKVVKAFLESGSQLSAIFAFLIVQLHSENLNSVESTYNKMKSLLTTMVEMPSFEKNPLIWRMMLQCCSPLPPEELKKIYYHALEKLPWVKILYYEAGKLIPQDLPEIQDLLVEKELRLHITPEELEILREDTVPPTNDAS